MDRELLKYDSTKLIKVIFNMDVFEGELVFSLKLTNYIHESEEQDNGKNTIKIKGELEAKNSDGDIATNIVMESFFNSTDSLSEEKIEKIVDSEEEYLKTPLLNEINMILGSLTGKALKVPIILPSFSEEEFSEED